MKLELPDNLDISKLEGFIETPSTKISKLVYTTSEATFFIENGNSVWTVLGSPQLPTTAPFYLMTDSTTTAKIEQIDITTDIPFSKLTVEVGSIPFASIFPVFNSSKNNSGIGSIRPVNLIMQESSMFEVKIRCDIADNPYPITGKLKFLQANTTKLC